MARPVKPLEQELCLLRSGRKTKKIMKKIVACKVVNGNVHCYDENGVAIRTITTMNAVSAVANGDVITVTKSNGRVELYDANTGSFKRSI
jgi:hypothetical protein